MHHLRSTVDKGSPPSDPYPAQRRLPTGAQMKRGLSLIPIVGGGVSLILAGVLLVYAHARRLRRDRRPYLLSMMMEEEGLYFAQRYQEDPATPAPDSYYFKGSVGTAGCRRNSGRCSTPRPTRASAPCNCSATGTTMTKRRMTTRQRRCLRGGPPATGRRQDALPLRQRRRRQHRHAAVRRHHRRPRQADLDRHPIGHPAFAGRRRPAGLVHRRAVAQADALVDDPSTTSPRTASGRASTTANSTCWRIPCGTA